MTDWGLTYEDEFGYSKITLDIQTKDTDLINYLMQYRGTRRVQSVIGRVLCGKYISQNLEDENKQLKDQIRELTTKNLDVVQDF